MRCEKTTAELQGIKLPVQGFPDHVITQLTEVILGLMKMNPPTPQTHGDQNGVILTHFILVIFVIKVDFFI